MRAGKTEEDGRITLIQSDIWIGFPRAEQVLDRLQGMIEAPRQTRMPGLLVHGASGIGKTMIARNLSRRYAPEYDPASGITRTPLLLLQAPPAPDERRFYLHILATVGAPATALSARAQNVASLEVRVVALLRDLGLRMIMIDEVHNLLAGTHREQRRFLNVLRYLSNELEVSLVCLGVSEAVDATTEGAERRSLGFAVVNFDIDDHFGSTLTRVSDLLLWLPPLMQEVLDPLSM